jgi:hypothetical protein
MCVVSAVFFNMIKSFVIAGILLLLQGFTVIEKPSQGGVCLSQEEQKLYKLIMAYRKSKKLPSIALSPKLTMVAQAHARDLADHYTFAFDNKCNPHSWSDKGKWTPCCYTSDHAQAKCMWDKPKEIAGYASEGFEIAYYTSKGATAEEGLAGWKKSPGHNPLLVNLGTWKQVKWNAIGIGIYGEYGIVWFGQIEDSGAVDSCPDTKPSTSRPRSENP